MADPLSITILRKKRDRIRDTIASYERRLKEAQADLAHVIAALRLFEMEGDSSDFPAYVDLNRIFRRGETSKFCLDAIAAEGPLDTRDLTRGLMPSKGINEDDKVLSQSIALRIVQTLRAHARRRRIDGTERRKGVCVRRLVTPPAASIRPIADRPSAAWPRPPPPCIGCHCSTDDDFPATRPPRRRRINMSR